MIANKKQILNGALERGLGSAAKGCRIFASITAAV
jgi:hypothetical protein